MMSDDDPLPDPSFRAAVRPTLIMLAVLAATYAAIWTLGWLATTPVLR